MAGAPGGAGAGGVADTNPAALIATGRSSRRRRRGPAPPPGARQRRQGLRRQLPLPGGQPTAGAPSSGERGGHLKGALGSGDWRWAAGSSPGPAGSAGRGLNRARCGLFLPGFALQGACGGKGGFLDLRRHVLSLFCHRDDSICHKTQDTGTQGCRCSPGAEPRRAGNGFVTGHATLSNFIYFFFYTEITSLFLHTLNNHGTVISHSPR